MDFDEFLPISIENDRDKTTEESKSSKGIIFTLGPLSLAVSFDPNAKRTSALVMGMCEHQVTHMIKLIESTHDLLDCPTILVNLWLNIMGSTRAHRVMGRKDAILRTETELGTHWMLDNQEFSLDQINFDRVTRCLTVMGAEMGWDIHAIDAQVEMAALLEEFHVSLFGASPRMQIRVRQAKAVLSRLRHWTHVNKQRVQVQVQTVSVSIEMDVALIILNS